MAKPLSTLRPVYVVGVGLHRYQAATETPYVELGLTAIRAALADAGVPWEANEASFIGTGLLGMAAGRPMLRHLGALGQPLVHVQNASASGSAAFRQACIEVASGLADVSLAIGVDKPARIPNAFNGTLALASEGISFASYFALLASEYLSKFHVDPGDLALVAVKNHGNGARNPFAQKQKARTVEEVLASRRISGVLTALQCCPVGEGAAAAIVMSEDGIKRWNVGSAKAIRVASFAVQSERVNDEVSEDALLTGRTTAEALRDAGLRAEQLDIVELHDAFTIEELLYTEAMGLVGAGQAAYAMREGVFAIGGACAVNPSGGLIAMGHPIGPTGVGQIAEIVSQLRGEAGARQQPHARTGLAHMCGVGSVCYAHVLTRD
jgi:acetyl-CoA acetyltransferase